MAGGPRAVVHGRWSLVEHFDTVVACCLTLTGVACGRVSEPYAVHTLDPVADAAGIPDAFSPSPDPAGPFSCQDERPPSMHLRYVYTPEADPARLVSTMVSQWASNGNEALLVTGLGALTTLSREGLPTEVVPESMLGRVSRIGPLADSALVRRDGSCNLVDRSGTTIAALGAFGGPSTEGIIDLSFSASGAALILSVGFLDIEHERVTAVEVHDRDGSLLRRMDGEHVGFVADDERLFVLGSGDRVHAVDLDGAERWQATYRSSVRSILGSRNGRAIYVHNESLGFYEGADNSGLLIVDGTPRVVPYLAEPGFSPDGQWVASAGHVLVMRERGEEIWRVTPTPNFLTDSVSVNHLGQVLLSGSARIGDAGQGETQSHAFLYDRTGALLTHCVGVSKDGRTFSGFDRTGTSLGLYGLFGVVVYDIR